jgi:hypothetical protein
MYFLENRYNKQIKDFHTENIGGFPLEKRMRRKKHCLKALASVSLMAATAIVVVEAYQCGISANEKEVIVERGEEYNLEDNISVQSGFTTAAIAGSADTNKVGTYTITATNESVNSLNTLTYSTSYKVKVEDTTGPTIEAKSKVTKQVGYYNQNAFDIKVYDLDLELSESDSKMNGSWYIKWENKLDIAKAGTYNGTIIATDCYGNESTKDITLVLIEPKKEEATVSTSNSKDLPEEIEEAEETSANTYTEQSSASTSSSSSKSSASTNSNIKQHNVSVSVSYEPLTANFYDFLNKVNQGVNRIYVSYDPSYVIGELIYYYLDMPYSASSSILYYDYRDTGGYIEFTDSSWQTLQSYLYTGSSSLSEYASYVSSACYSLNRNTTDEDLVNQINAYVCNYFTYNVTESSMITAMRNRTGQCYHYAHLFVDMCNSLGIPASYYATSTHAWAYVTVNGVTYRFDPTYNDTCGNQTAYSWLS